MPDPITVSLVPHVGWDDSATIPGPVEHNQFLVYVHSEGLAHRNPDKKLQVGIIGKQAGANFCPTNEFYGFTYPYQQQIAEEAKRLHGHASTKPHTDVPPPIPEAWDDEQPDEADVSVK